jgi:hypothetical protein
MKNITFEVLKCTGVETVNGKEVKIEGQSFGMYQNTEKDYEPNCKWFIIDFKSGVSIANGYSQQETIETAKNNYKAYVEKVCTEFYSNMVRRFNDAKIDADPNYYVVISTNQYNTREESVYMTYKEAEEQRVLLTLHHSNIYIEKRPKRKTA